MCLVDYINKYTNRENIMELFTPKLKEKIADIKEKYPEIKDFLEIDEYIEKNKEPEIVKAAQIGLMQLNFMKCLECLAKSDEDLKQLFTFFIYGIGMSIIAASKEGTGAEQIAQKLNKQYVLEMGRK